jgi:nitroreductase
MSDSLERNEFLETIKDRRSVRSYLDKTISKEILEEIVDAGRLAPSARNVQAWDFVVVTEKETLGKIAEISMPFIREAGALILVCGKPDHQRYVEDCSAATENIILAAKSFGIGSCWVAGVNKDYLPPIMEMLEIPKDRNIVALVSLGYFERNPDPHHKKELSEVIHWNKF